MKASFLHGDYTKELICDCGGLIACNDLDIAISAKLKAIFSKEYMRKFHMDGFKAIKEEEYTDRTTRLTELFSSHPNTLKRIDTMKKYYNSDEFKKLRGGLANKESPIIALNVKN